MEKDFLIFISTFQNGFYFNSLNIKVKFKLDLPKGNESLADFLKDVETTSKKESEE